MAIRYEVNEEKRTVVAIIDNTECDAIVMVDKMFRNTPFRTDHLYHQHMRKYYIKDTYVGVAKCNPDDEWDEEVGKELARKRVLRAHEVDVALAFEKIWDDMIEPMNKMGFFIDTRLRQHNREL